MELVNWARDSALQTGIAAIALIVSIVIGALGLMQLKRRTLAFAKLADTPLLTVGDNASSTGLSLLFNGHPIQNARFVIFRVTNVGNAPIRASDFESAMKVQLNFNARILSAHVEACMPKHLPVKPIAIDNAVHIPPLLLNPSDGFTCGILVIDFDGSIELVARAADTTTTGESESALGAPALLSLLSTLIGIGIALAAPKFQEPKWAALMIVLSMMFLGLGLGLPGLIHTNRAKKRGWPIAE